MQYEMYLELCLGAEPTEVLTDIPSLSIKKKNIEHNLLAFSYCLAIRECKV